MNWFYAKDGQQLGPVPFTEIERLYTEGQLTDDSLVWQQGSPNWIKLSAARAGSAAPAPEASAPVAAPAAAILPTETSAAPAKPLADYGDFIVWGYIGMLVPCVNFIVYVVLVVLNMLEYFERRKEVKEGRLPESDYSKMNPVLFVLGLVCCSGLLYPLYMYYRNKSGYFKPQPKAVPLTIIVVILAIIINVAIQLISMSVNGAAAMHNSTY